MYKNACLNKIIFCFVISIDFNHSTYNKYNKIFLNFHSQN